MLFRRPDLEAIVEGRVDLAFRRWRRPTVKGGGNLRTFLGVLDIDEVRQVEEGEISDGDARRAGFPDRPSLLASLATGPGRIYRVELRWAGEDPRVALRERDDLSPEEMDDLARRLARYDASSRRGPWTRRTLELIRDHPETRAADLARTASWDQAWLKANVRKLKNLGLSESLAVGYRLSPRGRAYVDGKPSRPQNS